MILRPLLLLLLIGGSFVVPRPQGRGRTYLDRTENTTPEPQGTRKGYAVPKASPPPTTPLPPPPPPPCPGYRTSPLASAIIRPPAPPGVHDKGYQEPNLACPPPPPTTTTTTTTTTPPPCPTAPPCPCCPISPPAPPCPQRLPAPPPASHKKGYQPPAAAPAAPQRAAPYETNHPPGIAAQQSLSESVSSVAEQKQSNTRNALTTQKVGGLSHYSSFQSNSHRGDPAISANYRQDQLAIKYSAPRPKSGYQSDRAMGLIHTSRDASFQRDLQAYQQVGRVGGHGLNNHARSNQIRQDPTNRAAPNPAWIPYFNDQPSQINRTSWTQTSGRPLDSRRLQERVSPPESFVRSSGGNNGNFEITYLGSLVRSPGDSTTLVRDANIRSALGSNGNIVSSQGLIQGSYNAASSSGSGGELSGSSLGSVATYPNSSPHFSGSGGSPPESSSGSGTTYSSSYARSSESAARSSGSYESSLGSGATYSDSSSGSDARLSASSLGSDANFEYRYPKYTRHEIIEVKTTKTPGKFSLNGLTYNAPAGR